MYLYIIHSYIRVPLVSVVAHVYVISRESLLARAKCISMCCVDLLPLGKRGTAEKNHEKHEMRRRGSSRRVHRLVSIVVVHSIVARTSEIDARKSNASLPHVRLALGNANLVFRTISLSLIDSREESPSDFVCFTLKIPVQERYSENRSVYFLIRLFIILFVLPHSYFRWSLAKATRQCILAEYVYIIYIYIIIIIKT